MDYEPIEVDESFAEQYLEEWVWSKVCEWRAFFESNYEDKFDEYYHLWKGIWKAEESERETERSKIISPALQQAVESNVAEIEEATFGRGRWFDVSDDMNDKERQDVQYLRNKLLEDFEEAKVRKAVSEVLINAAVYGTGIAELPIEEVLTMKPATQPVMDGQLQAVGVEISERTLVKMKPVLPQNFLIDPVATDIDEALGVCVDEFVSAHYVKELQEKGVFRDVYVGTASDDTELEPDEDLTIHRSDKVRLTRYYGLVPRELLEKEADDVEEGTSSMVEAIVVIANEGILLKAEENPFMMKDRPIVAFSWDISPGRFWGRGVCEKGYMSQKALDTELRARIDGLGLTIHPMMAMDASRMPRGADLRVRPGKTILTNGDPREILTPITFGQMNQTTFAQAQSLQQMVQQATGAVDSAGIAGQVNGEATAAGISMSLGAIIKRHKRTLINFQQGFLIPFVKKAAYRYMQFDPDNYPVSDYRFNATSSLGIIAREYEVTQLTQLLQTMSPESPLYPALIQSIVDNMNLSNREELLQQLQQASQPDPQQQQMAMAQQQAQMEFQQAQTQAIQAQAAESQSRAQKYQIEAQMIPMELEIKKIDATTDSLQKGSEDDREFERRLKVAELALKEKELDSKISNEAAEAELKKLLTNMEV
jgi:hypothetical protein